MSWDATIDDVDPLATIRYDVYVNGEFDSAAVGSTSTIVYVRTNGTNRFDVVAVDSSGNESPRSTVDIPNTWLC